MRLYLRLHRCVKPPPSALQARHLRTACHQHQLQQRSFSSTQRHSRRHITAEGVTTSPFDDLPNTGPPNPSPFYFETGYSAFAKRQSRPFPPPFLSLPSGSYSDPLTTHTRSRRPRPEVHGQQLKGITNGDDALIIAAASTFLAVNDGVGAWAQKDRGHAALWSRLIAHFWALEAEKTLLRHADGQDKILQVEDLDPVGWLEEAFEQTKAVTMVPPNEIMGTTTASSAVLHHRADGTQPVLLATTLGDCAIMVIRPTTEEIIYRAEEQWHWFDCPRQLGTRSPDTPKTVAVLDVVDIAEQDVVLVLSDGVSDNLWPHEICSNVTRSIARWRDGDDTDGARDGIVFVARELMHAAREIALDPNAESPFMERALDEGIPAEGGKLDDISVIVGLCSKRQEKH